MRFRVTSISIEQCGAQLCDVTNRLEDLLNATVADGVFGGEPDVFMLTVVAVDDDESENLRQTPRDKLALDNSYLSLAVSMSPSVIAAADYPDELRMVSMQLREKLSGRPKRLPKGFDFERCSSSVSAALGVYVPV